jgi:hypothetical protein
LLSRITSATRTSLSPAVRGPDVKSGRVSHQNPLAIEDLAAFTSSSENLVQQRQSYVEALRTEFESDGYNRNPSEIVGGLLRDALVRGSLPQA